MPTGQYGGLVATADTANAHRDDVVDHPAHGRAEPGADGGVHVHLRQRRCDFDGTDSSDPDGSVVSYAWDFGDGGTATGSTPSHDFVTSGTRDVTLTVTDDEGTTGSVVIPVAGDPHQRRRRRRRSR